MASLQDIVTNIQLALTTGEDPPFTPTTCCYALDPQVVLRTPPSSMFCCIQPNNVEVKERSWAGNNRINYIYGLHLTLWVFVQLNVDETGREDSWLLDPTLGSVQLCDTILSILQNYTSSEQFGYEVDSVDFESVSHDDVGWNSCLIRCHSDLSGRSA